MNGNSKKEILESGKFLFRFRSAKALLDDKPEAGGFQELQMQTIYFAQPHALNDPMEGVSDAFWDGDQVLWENLFRHYALCLLWYASDWLIFGTEELENLKVIAMLTELDLPTDTLRSMYREFWTEFCVAIESVKMASILGRRTAPLRRERFTSLLFLMHHTALHHLFQVLKKYGLASDFDLPIEALSENSLLTTINGWEDILLNGTTDQISLEDQLEFVASIHNRANRQLELGMLSRVDDKKQAHKLLALMTRFPEMYVDAFLQDLNYKNWRVACFSRRCVNSSMWGTYGNEHKGAALVFRTEQRDNKRVFPIMGLLGAGSRGCELEVRSINYRKRPPPLDSFLEVGVLPIKKLNHTWLKNESGAFSSRLQEMTNDMDTWRKSLWEKTFERATWKHPDWIHEDEQRLIVSTAFTDDPAPKPLTYNFSQLEGIVFGMRMSTEDKLRIVSIVEEKCRAENRLDFRFFQSFYSPSKGEMDIAELSLLKFE